MSISHHVVAPEGNTRAQSGKRPSAQRRFPVGAEVSAQGTSFRVWTPQSKQVSVVLEDGGEFSLFAEGSGYHSGLVGEIKAGALYKLKLDHGTFPDPASRFQPDGPHGYSQVVDGQAFPWTDQKWKGVSQAGHVIYEMHVGTFTKRGSWLAAAERLPYLRDLGVTILEIMPVADFPGRYGWGYDGVNFYAPSRLYGTPDDFRTFVDTAHANDLGVILDVVYNHVGPDGNFLKEFSSSYFTDRYLNDWGEALNFDGPDSKSVREFFVANAEYWIGEFHLDGLRLDATQQIFDASPHHLLADISSAVREAAPHRGTWIVAENEPQVARYVRPIKSGGYGLSALWNDDFHHAAIVALTGKTEAYYTDYKGSPQEFISAAKWGFLYQGQRYSWQKGARGTAALDLAPENFVQFIQNHDQVANSLRGHRIHALTSPGSLRVMTALLFLSPAIPMLFQGQEFASGSPFLYFADHNPELAKLVAEGRAEFLKQFPSIAQTESQELLHSPEQEDTFLKCKLDFDDIEKNRPLFDLHRDLIALRRNDAVIGQARRGSVDGSVIGPEAFMLRYFGGDGDDRLAIFNFGSQFDYLPASEPLIAPPEDRNWSQVWSSEEVRYGGESMQPALSEEGWRMPARTAVLMTASVVR